MRDVVIISRMKYKSIGNSLLRLWGYFFVLLLLTGCGLAGRFDLRNAEPGRVSTPTRSSDFIGETGSSDVLQAAISTGADAIINAINLRRVQEGLLPWVIEPKLIDLGYERAIDMAVRGYLDHSDPGSPQILVESALQERGYSGQAAELIFASQVALQEVAANTLEAWFDDPDHRAVLFNPDYRYAGIGIMGDGNRWVVVLVLVEGRP